MEGFGHFSGRPSRDLWESPRPRGERASSARLRRARPRNPPAPRGCWAGSSGEGSEPRAPRQPRRHRSPDSPWESRSLSDVAQRPPDGARKHRPRGWRPKDAWREPRTQHPPRGGSQHSPAWPPPFQRAPQQPRPGQHYPPAQGDSPSPYPDGAYSPLSGVFGAEEGQSGDPWAVPVCGGLDRWSFSSLPSEKSSAPSQDFRTLSACVCARKTAGGDRTEASAGGSLQPAASGQELRSQTLKAKLEEAVLSPRDQKIVALVLTRLKKAQRMRELQLQAAAAWEELKRSDHKVQVTLERERKLLLQQNRAQWQREKEQRRTRLGREQRVPGPGPDARRRQQPRDSRAQHVVPPEARWKVQWEEHTDRPERPRPEATFGKQGLELESKPAPAQEAGQEQERTPGKPSLQALQARLEQPCPQQHPHSAEGQKKVQEANLSSLVNYQARKVLMDCQVKAEELLRRLSLEQGSRRSPEMPRGLARERRRELRDQARGEDAQDPQVQLRAEELEEQRQVRARLLGTLAQQKAERAPGSAHRPLGGQASQRRELSVLRQKNQHILKLKAEKEEKYHIQGIKEAIRKKEERMRQLSQDKEAAAFEGLFQKVPRASGRERDGGGGGKAPAHSCSLGRTGMASEAQLRAGQHRGDY